MEKPRRSRGRRVAVLLGSALLMLFALYRSGDLGSISKRALFYIDRHPVDIFICALTLVIVITAFPRRLLTGLLYLWRHHPVVVAALALALGSGVMAGAWVYWSAHQVPPSGAGRVTPASLSVQSGVLVAGAIAAGVGFWFNDQRRRREDSTLRNETDRLAQESVKLDRDKSRVEDERFIKVVELLASDNPSVRMGALSSLEGLARSNPERLQEVINILCMQLRQRSGVDLARADRSSEPGIDLDSQVLNAQVSERLVRQSVQSVLIKLIPDIKLSDTWLSSDLPSGASVTDVRPVLVNLRGAHLEGFRLFSKAVDLDMDRAIIAGDLQVSRCDLNGDLRLAGAIIGGSVTLRESNITGNLSLSGATVSYVNISAVRVGDLSRFDVLEPPGDGRVKLQILGGSDLRRVVWPSKISQLHIVHCSIGAARDWKIEVGQELVMRRLSIADQLDLQGLKLPQAQRAVALREVEVVGLFTPPESCYMVLDADNNRILYQKVSSVPFYRKV